MAKGACVVKGGVHGEGEASVAKGGMHDKGGACVGYDEIRRYDQ